MLLVLWASRSASAVTAALMEAPTRTPVLHPVCARYPPPHTHRRVLCPNLSSSLIRITPSASRLSAPSLSPSRLQENVEGENCDRCKLGFYNLHRANQRGCEKCSCMGVSSLCSASTWTYQNVSATPQTQSLAMRARSI